MRLSLFLAAEDAAISVEWVVLTSGIVGLAFAAVMGVSDGTSSLGHDVSDNLSEMAVGDDAQEEDYVWNAHDPDSDHWWTNQELRAQQYAKLSDSGLQNRWTRHLREFENAVSAGDNSNCNGCKGAGNRLDSLYIVHRERVARGVASPDDAQALADARDRYEQSFGS